MGNRWSKEEIGLEILRLYAANAPLNFGDVQKNHLGTNLAVKVMGIEEEGLTLH